MTLVCSRTFLAGGGGVSLSEQMVIVRSKARQGSISDINKEVPAVEFSPKKKKKKKNRNS